MISQHKALIAVDGNSDAPLLRYAQVIPRLWPEAECEFIQVLGWPNRSRIGQPIPTHGEISKRLEASVAEHFGAGSPAQCRVVTGTLEDRLLEATAESGADLILVGHRAELSRRRALARRLAMKAPCSVWMRPEGSDASIHRVMAAVDFSNPSAYALSLAAQIARQTGLPECLALHVRGVELGAAEPRQDDFDAFLAPIDTSGVRINQIVAEGASVSHVASRFAESEKVDLIVMGSRGQTRSASVLLGSESEQMLTESSVPVLIAKRRGERISLLQALLDRSLHLPEPPRFN